MTPIYSNACKPLHAEKEENNGENYLTKNKTHSRELGNASDRSHNSSQSRIPRNSGHEFFKGFCLVDSLLLHLTFQLQKHRGSLEREVRIRVRKKRLWAAKKHEGKNNEKSDFKQNPIFHGFHLLVQVTTYVI